MLVTQISSLRDLSVLSVESRLQPASIGLRGQLGGQSGGQSDGGLDQCGHSEGKKKMNA